jgi:hypothetical protein
VTSLQGLMKVLNDNLKKANELYTELSSDVHTRITDCWSDDQATKLDALIGEKAERMQQHLFNASEMTGHIARRVHPMKPPGRIPPP